MANGPHQPSKLPQPTPIDQRTPSGGEKNAMNKMANADTDLDPLILAFDAMRVAARDQLSSILGWNWQDPLTVIPDLRTRIQEYRQKNLNAAQKNKLLEDLTMLHYYVTNRINLLKQRKLWS